MLWGVGAGPGGLPGSGPRALLAMIGWLPGRSHVLSFMAATRALGRILGPLEVESGLLGGSHHVLICGTVSTQVVHSCFLGIARGAMFWCHWTLLVPFVLVCVPSRSCSPEGRAPAPVLPCAVGSCGPPCRFTGAHGCGSAASSPAHGPPDLAGLGLPLRRLDLREAQPVPSLRR